MRKTYTVVLTPNSAGGWLVEVPALPGCLTEGPTLTEALLMAEDVVRGYLEVLQEDSQAAPREGAGVLVRLGRNREAIVRKISVTLPRGAAKVAQASAGQCSSAAGCAAAGRASWSGAKRAVM